MIWFVLDPRCAILSSPHCTGPPSAIRQPSIRLLASNLLGLVSIKTNVQVHHVGSTLV